MANISQNVNIEMLEKLPDGTYKRKYPKTRSDTGVTFDEHLAENATIKHKAKEIGFSETELTATNVNEAILETFMLGNSTKRDLVDKLLLVDDSLPITQSSSWQEVLANISMISTGKKWASGTVLPVDDIITVRGLNFKPKAIIMYANQPNTAKYHVGIYLDEIGDSSLNATFGTNYSGEGNTRYLVRPATIYNDGFYSVKPIPSNETYGGVYNWIAYE